MKRDADAGEKTVYFLDWIDSPSSLLSFMNHDTHYDE